jgi:hypothetical protein
LILPFTSNLNPGAVVPIPKFPFVILNAELICEKLICPDVEIL